MHEIDDVLWQEGSHLTEAASLFAPPSASKSSVAKLPLKRGFVERLVGQADRGSGVLQPIQVRCTQLLQAVSAPEVAHECVHLALGTADEQVGLALLL